MNKVTMSKAVNFCHFAKSISNYRETQKISNERVGYTHLSNNSPTAIVFFPNDLKIARSRLSSNTTFMYGYLISRKEKLL